MKYIKFILNLLFFWPKNIASYFIWAGPLITRIIIGYVFMITGLAKLKNLDIVTENFVNWKIPFPNFMAMFVSGWEFIGGLFLIIGFMTRISAGVLSAIMVVAIITVKSLDIEVFDDFLFFEETIYLAIFIWLAISGAGKISLDYLIERKFVKK